ncbi:high nitrogen upregulated cytochrome P450 monooxygenase 2 [Trametes polyzona]|nr:high nitrogen upregulated cytochrome P450 monooxygenase 2 [Trametes polyzona]
MAAANFNNTAQLSETQSVVVVIMLALVTHQFFRRVETFSIAVHLSFLCLPMAIGFELFRTRMPPLSSAFNSATVFLSTLLLSVAIYRLSPFHPLARYPGPLGARLTKFWMACIGYTGRQHLYIQSLHEKYGDVVRTGPNELSFRDASLVNDILGWPGLPKGPLVIGRTLAATNPPLLGITDPAVHQERRKPWNRAFSAAALKEYEPFVAARAAQLVRVLESQKGTFDISRFFNYFTYDFMCDMAYGGGSNLLDNGDAGDIWHTMEQGWPAATFFGHVPWLASMYAAHIPLISASVSRILSHCEEFTLKRIKRGATRKDVFHYLSNEDQPEKGSPPVEQLVGDGVLAIIAGADTTSSALTSLFFLLVTHPEAYKRLQAEVDQFYPAGEDACGQKHHSQMPYLTACINEALRLYPPVPGGMQRQVPHHGQGATLGPYFVPAGTALYLHPYSLHRDPRHFSPRPNDFSPERWLRPLPLPGLPSSDPATPGESGERHAHDERAFLPFSHGPANCVGKRLAMQEMRTVVCAVMQRLEVRAAGSGGGLEARAYDEGFKDFFVTKRPALPVSVTVRPRSA